MRKEDHILLHQEQPRRDVKPMQHRLAPHEDEHPRDGHHGDAKLEGVGLAILVGIVQHEPIQSNRCLQVRHHHDDHLMGAHPRVGRDGAALAGHHARVVFS